MKRIVSIFIILGLMLTLSSMAIIPEKHGKKHFDDEKSNAIADTIPEKEKLLGFIDDLNNCTRLLKDSVLSDINIDFEDSGHMKVFTMHKNALAEPFVSIRNNKKDSLKKHFVVISDGAFNENVVCLSDPGIISYKKKNLKNGNEKIVIVREKTLKHEICTKTIIHDLTDSKKDTHRTSTFHVTADDDGNVEVLNNGKALNLSDFDGVTKGIAKDVEKILIVRTKSGDEIKLNVEEDKGTSK